jgi:hypothetical protein
VLLPGALGYTTSTISSSAVSGSITTTKVSPAAGDIDASKPEALTTDIVPALLFSAADNVVSWDMDEYNLVGISTSYSGF